MAVQPCMEWIPIIKKNIRFGDQPTNIDPNDIDIITIYIYNCYGLDISSGTSGTCLWILMPSVPATEQHVRCAYIQTEHLWKLSQLELDIPDPTSWGWKLSLNPFMARLHFIWCWFFTENLGVHYRITWQLFLQKKQNQLYEVLQVWTKKCKNVDFVPRTKMV